ncbi:hypothetical protein LTR56_019583 [Elasticomyces elasticus]|nr:hypothetical protein LTR56_019583 [Elasticomyces elasticus]KAK3634482.1 hypothetical protein LTR22_019641 [Elasticomyces elasticus]KAK4917088.1 hypothetical protein LTR49_014991 [Elasticomyces elasticus]KAK5750758.1 hypothetical protein LTS12_019203 [Elasticomyces elasticus]
MAELGLIAGIVGLVGAGAKLSIAIFDFASTIGHAGKELQNFGTEISQLCSFLQQLHILLNHAHFKHARTFVDDAERTVRQCQSAFVDVESIISGLRKKKGDDTFPSVDFVDKVKWTFKRSRVLALRSTLESCKLTLNVMLSTMQLAETLSQKPCRDREHCGLEEAQFAATTQNLVISQQCAVERLEEYEDEVENEDEASKLLPVSYNLPEHAHFGKNNRRRSRTKLLRMFSGLTVVTDKHHYTPPPTPPPPPLRAQRASVWLSDIVLGDAAAHDMHPGELRQKRFSSVGTADVPLQLLKKWTDQGDPRCGGAMQLAQPTTTIGDRNMWKDCNFAFPTPDETTERTADPLESLPALPSVIAVARMGTEPVSPKTSRFSSITALFPSKVTIDADIEAIYGTAGTVESSEQTHEGVISAIIASYDASVRATECDLTLICGGTSKLIGRHEKPLQAVKRIEDLGLEARLVLRKRVG